MRLCACDAKWFKHSPELLGSSSDHFKERVFQIIKTQLEIRAKQSVRFHFLLFLFKYCHVGKRGTEPWTHGSVLVLKTRAQNTDLPRKSQRYWSAIRVANLAGDGMGKALLTKVSCPPLLSNSIAIVAAQPVTLCLQSGVVMAAGRRRNHSSCQIWASFLDPLHLSPASSVAFTLPKHSTKPYMNEDFLYAGLKLKIENRSLTE